LNRAAIDFGHVGPVTISEVAAEVHGLDCVCSSRRRRCGSALGPGNQEESERGQQSYSCAFSNAMSPKHGSVPFFICDVSESVFRRCGRRTVTPVYGRTNSTIRADAHAADQRPVAGPRTTRRGRRDQATSRQLFIAVNNLHAQRQTAASEFPPAVVDQ